MLGNSQIRRKAAQRVGLWGAWHPTVFSRLGLGSFGLWLLELRKVERARGDPEGFRIPA